MFSRVAIHIAPFPEGHLIVWMGSVLEVIRLRRRLIVWMVSVLEVIWSGYERVEQQIWTPANWA